MVANNNERNQTGQVDKGDPLLKVRILTPRHPVFALLRRSGPRNLRATFS
jgi:hypothetical protein